MPNRRSEVLVTEFLRDALAVDALGVPELEARVRATGLFHALTFRSVWWQRSIIECGAPLRVTLLFGLR